MRGFDVGSLEYAHSEEVIRWGDFGPAPVSNINIVEDFQGTDRCKGVSRTMASTAAAAGPGLAWCDRAIVTGETSGRTSPSPCPGFCFTSSSPSESSGPLLPSRRLSSEAARGRGMARVSAGSQTIRRRRRVVCRTAPRGFRDYESRNGPRRNGFRRSKGWEFGKGSGAERPGSRSGSGTGAGLVGCGGGAEDGGGPGATAAFPVKVDEEWEEHAREWAHRPRRIALFVEPSPFAYVCGYKNRFQNFIRYLREMGDEVLIVTTDRGVPAEFHGAKVVGSWSFQFPMYENLFLSLALSPRIFSEVRAFKPDIIHASSPGVMVFGALLIAKLLRVPIVLSYHTHVPMYIPKYTFSWLVTPMWWVIRFLHRAADWTLVVSQVLGRELRAKGAAAAGTIGVWSKGVDSESFNPRFRSAATRAELTGGRPERPLVVHVGRLGAEKNLGFLKEVMEGLPEAHLAVVGDGPCRRELEALLRGTKVTFTGMLSGDALSEAYASGDVFVTPSETETLGFVVLEAMASGVPVVAARAGGIIDIVTREGETGFLYAPGDVADCVAKIRALVDSAPLRESVARAARADVEKLDWRASTRQVRNEMYTSAVWCWRRGRENRFRWFWQRQRAQPALPSP